MAHQHGHRQVVLKTVLRPDQGIKGGVTSEDMSVQQVQEPRGVQTDLLGSALDWSVPNCIEQELSFVWLLEIHSRVQCTPVCVHVEGRDQF